MTRSAPRIDPEELLANAAWVRALARSLVGDASLADDVAQQTMVAAIERPPRAGVPLGAWMARVARNLSFNARRAERRRALHEAAAPSHAASPSPEESVARTEMFRVVVDAVLALEPIYRDVVVLRFFDDLETTEVARRLDVPLETARTRLKRALATLRERLDAEYGDRRAWALVLVGPKAAPRVATATTATVLGGALVAKMLFAAATVVALIVGGWYVVSTGGAGARATSHVETAAAPAPAGGARAAPPRTRVAATETPPAAPAAPEASPADGAPSRWMLRGRLDHFDGDDGPRAKVVAFFRHDGSDTSKAPEPLVADATVDGRFEIEFTASMASATGKKAFVVFVDHPDYLIARAEVVVPEHVSADAAGAAIVECAIELHRAAILNVRVVDADDRGISGAHVGAFEFRDGMPDDQSSGYAAADASGVARLRLRPGVAFFVVGAADGLAPAAVRASGGDEQTTLLLAYGVAIRGRVVENGRPVAGATVRARVTRFGGRELEMSGARVHWEAGGVLATSEATATTDASGAYRIAGLADEEDYSVELLRVGADRELAGFTRREEAPAVDVDFDVATSKLVVEVRSDGVPVKDVWLYGIGSTRAPKTDENGRATCEASAGTRLQIRASRDGFKQSTVQLVAPKAGDSEVVPIDLVAIARRGKFVVAVHDGDGRPIETASLAFFKDAKAADDSPWDPIRFTLPRQAADGRVVVDDLDPGPYRLVVRAGRNSNPDFTWDGDEGTWLDASMDVTVPEAGDVEIVVATRRGGRLRLAARDADGKLVVAACTIRDAAGQVVGCSMAARYGSRGAFGMGRGYLDANAFTDVAEALPAGKYRVTLSIDGGAEKSVDAEIVAGKTTVLDVTLDGVAGPRPRWSVAPAQAK